MAGFLDTIFGASGPETHEDVFRTVHNDVFNPLVPSHHHFPDFFGHAGSAPNRGDAVFAAFESVFHGPRGFNSGGK